MRLTTDLLFAAPSYINATNDRELLLRGHRIPVIENLGVTKDLNDVIDLTDNDIRVLANFPKLVRLRGLLLARNRISHIQPDLAINLPNLNTIVLASNSLAQLSDLDPLSGFSNLLYVSIIDNPVTIKQNYRLYVIWRNPHIRVLDFQKVKDQERLKSVELFGTLEAPSDLASEIMGQKSRPADPFAPSAKQFVGKLTEQDKLRLRESLKNAQSLNEIERIERALNSGYF